MNELSDVFNPHRGEYPFSSTGFLNAEKHRGELSTLAGAAGHLLRERLDELKRLPADP
jgi:hypothetical protein